MQIPPHELIDGVVRTLLDDVLPAVQGRFARGQVYAVADVLRNLRDRVEEKAMLLDMESDSAAAALDAALRALRAAGHATAPIDVALAGVPTAPPLARVEALRQALVVAIDVMGAHGGPADAQRAVAGHLAGQALRDAMTLKPSLLAEISKG